MKARLTLYSIVLLLVTLFSSRFVNRQVGAASLPQKKQQEVILFQAAQEDWNNQRWENAVAKLREFVHKFPDHPQAAEAHFQIGFHLSYIATPDEAIAEYEKAIAKAPGTHEAHESLIGIASLKFWLQEYEQSYNLFQQVIKETKDWSLIKECTFRMKEIGKLIAQQKLPSPRIGRADCGSKALAIIFEKQQMEISAEEMRKLIKLERGGATMRQLKEASRAKGLKAWGVKLKADQLIAIRKPFIAFVRPNHYVVVTNTSKGKIEFTDPHRGRTYRTRDRFQKMWNGYSLIFAKEVPSKLRPQLLSTANMEYIRGGHHLHGMNLGGASGNPATKFEHDPASPCGPGLPSWSVNLSNYNLIVQDTDFSYSGRGPGVGLTRTYNADDPRDSAFGRSWTFNYDVFLVVNANMGVDVKREDGKVDNFVSRGDGTFDSPRWVHDQLIRNTNGTYKLEIKRSKLTQLFNAQGRLAQITDRNNNSVTLQYDSNNRLISVTDTVGRATQFNYNATGKVIEVIDPINRRATFTYDADNNLVSTVDMAGNVISYTYNANSYMTSITTPRGTTQIRNGTTSHFTEFPYVVKDVIDPAGNITHFDTGDMIAWVVDAKGKRTFYFNDANGQTTEIEDPMGNKVGLDFGTTDGDLTRITDANGRSTNLTYDSRGNVTKVTDPLGNNISFTYDSKDNLTQLVDPLNNSYTYQYDARDNLTQVTDPRNGITTFAYDTFGQLISLTDVRNNLTSFTYDIAGNLATTINPVSGLTSYTYDGVGRLSSMTDPKAQTFSYTYDGIDRLTQITQLSGTTTNYTYSCCKLTGITDSAGTLGFVYDSANRLTQFTNTRNQIIQYAYDANGNLTLLTYPDGKSVRYEYDAANRLKKVTDWLNNATVYNYDATDNLISTINSNGTLTGYQYDTANRLVGLTNTRSDGAVISAYKYTQDARGSRTGITSVEPVSPVVPSKNVTSTYDTDNRIQTAAGVIYTHDANGNLTTTSGMNPTTYTYDVFNRLTQIISSSHNTQYQYDGMGNRITRTINGSTTKYIVDSDGTLLAETDNIGNITSYHIYGFGLISKITPADQTYYYHYDGLGSTVAITDSLGNIVNRYAYDPFGNLSSNSAEIIPNSFRYIGGSGVIDEGNGLFYMNARYYDPKIGRFINKDPAGSRSTPNLYAYVGNDPVDRIDPSGLAYFAKRPLRFWGLSIYYTNPGNDFSNTELAHEQLVFEDGKSPSNVGFAGDGQFPEKDLSGYQRTSRYYDDALMRQALKNLEGKDGYYLFIGNNCQNWSQRLRKEYRRLEKQGRR